MILAVLFAGCLAFLLILRATNVVSVTGDAARIAIAAAEVMNTPHLTDDQKEAQVRKAAIGLLKSFVVITLIGSAAVAAPAALVWLGSALGHYELQAAIDLASSWPFILGTTVILLLAWAAFRRFGNRGAAAADGLPGVPYGGSDRLLHRVAFTTPNIQKGLAEFETRRFRERIRPEFAEAPVFVTSLPRAGTTVMLDILADLPEFASATYRSMPFALTPMLWSSFTRGFQRKAGEAERAHGDGLKVGFDSPEAFEEMVWKAFWPQNYADDAIKPWSETDRDAAFEAFFRTYMCKIVAGKGGAARRYVSKNNANIARLPLIERLYPDATVVVPIRDPWSQTASLLRQHQRFGALHAQDAFARDYMEGLGHYEFGQALRPISFPGRTIPLDRADQPDFWLEYWISAYQRVLETAGPRVVFVDHDALCREPRRYLPVLSDALGVSDPDALMSAASRLNPQRAAPRPEANRELLAHAEALHAELAGLAIQPHSKIRVIA